MSVEQWSLGAAASARLTAEPDSQCLLYVSMHSTDSEASDVSHDGPKGCI